MNNFIYLGSSSPRRKELLRQMGLDSKVLTFDAEEILDQDIDAHILASNLSEMKMNACLKHYPEYKNKSWILTADTLISQDGHKLGKPKDREDAREMLLKLQGCSHQVITGFSIYCPLEDKIITEYESTDVTFSTMNSREIDSYLDTEEWKGVAGAYRIQEQGGKYISSLNGTFYNVMGLPINRIYVILGRLNFSN